MQFSLNSPPSLSFFPHFRGLFAKIRQRADMYLYITCNEYLGFCVFSFIQIFSVASISPEQRIRLCHEKCICLEQCEKGCKFEILLVACRITHTEPPRTCTFAYVVHTRKDNREKNVPIVMRKRNPRILVNFPAAPKEINRFPVCVHSLVPSGPRSVSGAKTDR